MHDLPESFISSLLNRLTDENTTGILLTGSFARGNARQYSDVDIRQYLRKMPERPFDAYRLELMEGKLVSITLTTCEETYADLQDPQKVIWILPGLQQSRILLDRDGLLAQLIQDVQSVSLIPLQASIEQAVSRNLSGYAEEVHKILAGLEHEDESMVLYAVWGITRGMANLMLVWNGTLIPSENVFINLVQTAAGVNSLWTHHFREAVGLDPLESNDLPFISYGVASLRLYRETVRLFRGILKREEEDVVEQSLQLIQEAGY
jgi:hypothetical protein